MLRVVLHWSRHIENIFGSDDIGSCVLISVRQRCLAIWHSKNFMIFMDTINVKRVRLGKMALLTKIYPLMPLSVAVTIF